MLNVNNKDTRTTSYFTPFSSVSIVDFEQFNVCWVAINVLILLTAVAHLQPRQVTQMTVLF